MPPNGTPFQKTGRRLFNGLGETIEAAVHLAACSKDQQVIDFKDRLIDAAIETQKANGYIGQFTATEGNRQFFEGFAAEDAAFLCLAFGNDARLFGSVQSLQSRPEADGLLCGCLRAL